MTFFYKKCIFSYFWKNWEILFTKHYSKNSILFNCLPWKNVYFILILSKKGCFLRRYFQTSCQRFFEGDIKLQIFYTVRNWWFTIPFSFWQMLWYICWISSKYSFVRSMNVVNSLMNLLPFLKRKTPRKDCNGQPQRDTLQKIIINKYAQTL